MSKYASRTTVSPEKTMTEIQTILKKYNASKFGFMTEDTRAILAFEMANRRIRFCLPLPSLQDCKRDERGKHINDDAAKKRQEQAIKQKWRALLLAIKAKLESVECGIETFEEAFMAHVVLPSGQTMAEWAAPQIESSYSSGKMPPLLGYSH